MTTPSVKASPRAETYLTAEELARAVGISVTTLERLMSLGLVEPTPSAHGLGAPSFSAAAARRLGRMLRLHRDLRVNFIGAAIIVDLVEQLECGPSTPGR